VRISSAKRNWGKTANLRTCTENLQSMG